MKALFENSLLCTLSIEKLHLVLCASNGTCVLLCVTYPEISQEKFKLKQGVSDKPSSITHNFS